MKLHRFYIAPGTIELKHDFWLHEPALLHQWHNVLRFRSGQEVALFDGIRTDRLYKIDEITPKEAHLQTVTDLKRRVPQREIYVLWGLLKKDKNDWLIQKGTELGASHFLPLITERCERADLSQNRLERWQKIAVEAAEQCERSDIPAIREPLRLDTAIAEFNGKITLLVAEKGDETNANSYEKVGVFIGPEGGWSDTEKTLFKQLKIPPLNLHDFTLRAETAAITAIAKLTT